MRCRTVKVWVTRDSEQGEEPDLIFVHGRKPKLVDGTWSADVLCMVVPEVKSGKCKMLKLVAVDE